jgi:hypothetical protein
MKEIGIAAAAAHSLADGARSGASEAFGEPAIAGFEDEALSLGRAREEVDREVLTGWLPALAVWNVISWVTQSIDGLCRCNHKYPRTAEAERSRVVRRNQTGC